MTTLQIIIHCLPREIDALERVLDDLKKSSYFLNKEDNVILDISLNVSPLFTNWDKSILDKDFFIRKFSLLERKSNWTLRNSFLVEDNDKCLGINDKRRNSIRNSGDDVTHFMYLDLDVFFSFLNLKYLFEGIKNIQNEYQILSSQLVKLWDSSWDILTNKNYLNLDSDFHKNIDPYSIESININNLLQNNVNIQKLPTIKFGGGWFNTFSSNLLKLIDIPDSLGSYGLDDTFIMEGAKLMQAKGYDISQYAIEGIIVCENIKYSIYDFNPYEKYISDNSFHNKGRDFKQKYRENSSKNFTLELNKLNNRI